MAVAAPTVTGRIRRDWRLKGAVTNRGSPIWEPVTRTTTLVGTTAATGPITPGRFPPALTIFTCAAPIRTVNQHIPPVCLETSARFPAHSLFPIRADGRTTPGCL